MCNSELLYRNTLVASKPSTDAMSRQLQLGGNPDPETTITLSVNGNALNNGTEQTRETAFGYIVDDGKERMGEGSQYLGRAEKFTNHIAEYRAIIAGVQEIRQRRSADEVHLDIKTSDEIIRDQLKNAADVEKLEEQYERTMEELRQFASYEVEYVAEEQGNRIDEADNLADTEFDF